MKDGIYRYAIEMQAPIGSRRGSLELTLADGIAKGFLTIFQHTAPILEGRCKSKKIHFTGKMKTLLYFLPYTADGDMDDDRIRLIFFTEKGNFPVTGKLEIAEC